MPDFGTPLVSSTFSRVTSGLTRSVILANINRAEEEILFTQEQLATGLRITRPSVDPIGANRVMDFQIRVERSTQFIRNIDASLHRLTMSDGSLESANDLINRSRVIALSQVQSTADAGSRTLAAQEVNELLQQAINLANSRFEDRYLFAGSRNGTAPVTVVGGAVAFTGDVKELKTSVSDGFTAATNVSADDAFGVFSDGIRGQNLATLNTIDLNPAVRNATKLTALRGGAGISAGSISITGAAAAVVDLSIAESVGDVVDLINAKTATTGVTAAINGASNGLSLTRAGGGIIVVNEVNGGKTASHLGIYTGSGGAASPVVGTNIDPTLTKDTLIGDLYAGAGIGLSGITITNATADATFAATIGSSVFSLTATIESLLNAVNNSGSYVDASINEAGTGIDVRSRLSGGRLTISEATGTGTTATNLGLRSTLARAKLSDLNGGIGIDSVDGFDLRIVRKDGGQLYIDVDQATTVQDVINTINGDPFLSAIINGSNEIEITDASVGAGDLRVENYNGSYAAANLGIEGVTPNAAGPITVSGTALTYVGVQPEGLFTALTNLRSSLLANNTNGISTAMSLLDRAQERLLGARSSVGSRIAAIEMTRNRLEYENTELEKMLSEVRDVDLAEAATRMQFQQTVLQAGLAVAARIMQSSLLNYL